MDPGVSGNGLARDCGRGMAPSAGGDPGVRPAVEARVHRGLRAALPPAVQHPHARGGGHGRGEAGGVLCIQNLGLESVQFAVTNSLSPNFGPLVPKFPSLGSNFEVLKSSFWWQLPDRS